MTVTRQIGQGLAGIGIALTLAGCSGASSLSTGALFGSSSDKAAAAPAPTVVPQTPADRALHVGATTARAKRCGYVFDPAGVRTAYLAYEASQGGAADQLARTEKSYDYTVASVAKSIAGNEDYCSDEQTSVIKKDLTRVLAGDFSAPAKKASPLADGWWGGSSSPKPLDRNEAFKTKDSI